MEIQTVLRVKNSPIGVVCPRAFSAPWILCASILGRWPRLLHHAPLALQNRINKILSALVAENGCMKFIRRCWFSLLCVLCETFAPFAVRIGSTPQRSQSRTQSSAKKMLRFKSDLNPKCRNVRRNIQQRRCYQFKPVPIRQVA